MAANPPVYDAVPAHRALRPSDGSSRLSGFSNLFRKEMGDWFHTRRWWVQMLTWFGIINLFVAFVLFVVPSIEAQEQQASGAEAAAPTLPELQQMGVELLFAFIVTAGSIGTMILAQDEVIGEKQSGTAAWILSKPAARASFILSKLAANTIGVLLFILIIPAVIGYGEIWLAAGSPRPVGPFLAAMGVAALALLFYLTLPTMLGVLFEGRGGVIGISLGILLGGSILMNLFQPVALVLPVALQNFAPMLALGQPLPQAAWIEIGMTAVWCVVFVIVALWRFEKLEL